MALLTPTEIIPMCGKKFVFSYSPSHMATMAFIFGYLDASCHTKYGVFATMQTGNMIFLGNQLEPQYALNYFIHRNMYLLAANIVAGGCIGPLLSCAVLEYCGDRTKAYAVLNAIFAMSCFGVCLLEAIIGGTPAGETAVRAARYDYLVLVFSCTGSALVHWSSKLGMCVHTPVCACVLYPIDPSSSSAAGSALGGSHLGQLFLDHIPVWQNFALLSEE